jgi:uncharacterized protein YkwD
VVLPMRKKMGRRTLPFLFSLLLVLAAPGAGWACDNEGKGPGEISTDEAREALVCLVNERRKKQGVRRLRTNGRLQGAAQAHSDSMDSDNYFAHNSPAGASPLSRIRGSGYLAGADSWGIAENIGWGIGGQATPRSVVKRWMGSSGHRHVMLSRSYRHLGIGVTVGSPLGGGDDGMIYTADFGYRS